MSPTLMYKFYRTYGGSRLSSIGSANLYILRGVGSISGCVWSRVFETLCGDFLDTEYTPRAKALWLKSEVPAPVIAPMPRICYGAALVSARDFLSDGRQKCAVFTQ